MILVKHVLADARKRLVVVNQEASIFDAATVLANRNTPLALVCDSEGIVLGVISQSHVVNALATARADALNLNAGAIMSEPLLSCHDEDPLQGIWSVMNVQALPCAPIVDKDGRAQGILHARDVAIALIDEGIYEEGLLRDYVMGIGYQ
jgi:CBS domain-containing protein